MTPTDPDPEYDYILNGSIPGADEMSVEELAALLDNLTPQEEEATVRLKHPECPN